MQKVFYEIEKYQMIRTNEKIIVGVSGGADSLCLLFVLQKYREKVPFDLMAVHVEHGIRGQESLEDAKFVEQICRAQHILFRCFSFDVPQMAAEQKLSVEEAARMARYQAFAQVRKEWGADKIAVAHNQNDQAETMLFRMARGTGLAGAGGIRPVNGKIIRPLLSVSRAEIEAYLRQQKISWREDATNADTDYTRNCLRHRVLPVLEEQVNEKSVQHLAELGEELQRLQIYMEKAVEKLLVKFARPVQQKETAEKQHEEVCGKSEGYKIDVRAFADTEEIVQEYMIRECLKRAGCSGRDVGRTHIEAVRTLAHMQSGKQVVLPDQWYASKEFEWLVFARKKDGKKQRQKAAEEVCLNASVPGETETPQGSFVFRVFPYKNQNILQKTYTKWLNYDKIDCTLQLRTRRAGDYLVINAQGGRKKLKQYFIEEKIPADERDRILLLAAGSEILWVVGHRINEAYKVMPGTKHILEIRKMGEYHGRENQCFNSGSGSRQTN